MTTDRKYDPNYFVIRGAGSVIVQCQKTMNIKIIIPHIYDEFLIYFGPYRILEMYIAVCQVIPGSIPLLTHS